MYRTTVVHGRARLCVGGLFVLWTVASTVSALDNAPRVSLEYPSADALRAQIDMLRNRAPEKFARARTDFDLAVRSSIILRDMAPTLPGPPKVAPIVPLERPPLPGIPRRKNVLASIKRLESVPGAERLIAFLHEHMEDRCVEPTAELGLALADVLLNGWEDWTQWEGTLLTERLASYPDLHRAYALRVIEELHLKALLALTLDILCDPSVPKYVRRRAESATISLGRTPATLEVLLNRYQTIDDDIVRYSLKSCIESISKGLRPDPRARIWAAHLTESDDFLRGVAVIETANALLYRECWAERVDERAKVMGRLREIAENDANDFIRKQAQRKLRTLHAMETEVVSTPEGEKENSSE